jgi:hypothetical protein
MGLDTRLPDEQEGRGGRVLWNEAGVIIIEVKPGQREVYSDDGTPRAESNTSQKAGKGPKPTPTSSLGG